MYPNLSYLLNGLIGTPVDNWTSIVQTFGLLLVMAFLASAYFLRLEMERYERMGLIKPTMSKITIGAPASVLDLGLSGIWGFFLGFKGYYAATHTAEFILDPASVILSDKGSIVGGLVFGSILAGLRWWEKYQAGKNGVKEVVKQVFPSTKIWDITIVSAISGILGAKVFAIFEDVNGLSDFMRHPIQSLLSGSGLAIYGGLIGGFIGVAIYIIRLRVPIFHMMDATAPSLIMGYAVGRIGCHLSGDGDWGIANTAPAPSWIPNWLWSTSYPHNVINAGEPIAGCSMRYCYELVPPVFPTPIYETILGLFIFGILWSLRKRMPYTGMIWFLYMLLNGIERWYIEKIRINPKLPFLGMELTQAEIIALMYVIIGVLGLGLVYFFKFKPLPKERG
jgi:phosphatidylglycerol---prolipoprotein diacylglyceryl transferase